LILLATLPIVEGSIAGDARLGTALVANANIRLSGSFDLFCRLLGVATLL
jgi:hypothetical protein